MYLADLHIHSHYSMATSKACNPEELAVWAVYKGLNLLGSGDFTHPAWRQELKDKLEEAEDGLFRLREDFLPKQACRDGESVRYILSAEISSVYKKDGKTRKVHNLIFLPSFAAADALSARLEKVGNIRSDGRPILGLDSKVLLEMALDVCPEVIFVPAHIWTPHFSVLGAKSGFDSIETCFEDLTPEIFALETGLSSDPAMNGRISALDRFTLISNSDAHSPCNLAREANLISGELSFDGIRNALREPAQGFEGTVEFFPEEGKYHWDGHRQCNICWEPKQTRAAHGMCPVCGRPVTLGVLHRIEELADREADHPATQYRRFVRLIPLMTIISELIGGGKKAHAMYMALLQRFGNEMTVLQEAKVTEIQSTAGQALAEAIGRMREGAIEISPGYDGLYGQVHITRESNGQKREAVD